MPKRYGLRDVHWSRLEALGLPGDALHVGMTAKDNRLFVEAVLYRYRAGIAWRDLPARFGDWHVIYVRFDRWSKQGVWQRVFEQLSKESDNEYAMIDATVVRAHRSAAGARKKGAMDKMDKERTPTKQTKNQAREAESTPTESTEASLL